MSVAWRTMALVYIAVAPDGGDGPGGSLRRLDDAGAPVGGVEEVQDLAAAVAARERDVGPRWVWADTARAYPPLLRAGVRVARCLDLVLTEALLLGRDGSFDLPRGLGASWARLRHLAVPDSAGSPAAAHRAADGGAGTQPALFEPERALPGGADPLTAVVELTVDYLARIAAAPRAGDFHLLVAAESAGALAADE